MNWVSIALQTIPALIAIGVMYGVLKTRLDGLITGQIQINAQLAQIIGENQESRIIERLQEQTNKMFERQLNELSDRLSKIEEQVKKLDKIESEVLNIQTRCIQHTRDAMKDFINIKQG